MLILNSEQIVNSVSILEIIESVEKAFLLQESGNFLMPDRMHVEYGKNILLLMPAFSANFFSTKLVSVFPDNTKKDKPALYGAVLLNDSETGKPLALLEGSMLTALRTAAVGALGVAYTSPKNVSALGLIGAGFQGFHQVLFSSAIRNIRTVNIYDPFVKDMNGFLKRLQNYLPHIAFKICKHPEEVVSQSEVIITATSSKTPVVPDDAKLLKGKHFIGIGSYTPDMREFPDSLFSMTNEIIIDTDHAKSESGDVKTPLEKNLIRENQLFRLGELINGKITIDTANTTFFKSVGMALLDLLTAQTIYKKAKEKGIGTTVEF